MMKKEKQCEKMTEREVRQTSQADWQGNLSEESNDS